MNKFLKNLLILFILIQPVLDLTFFYGSVSTLIRVIIISLFFCLTLIKEKNKKIIYGFIGYFLLLILFFVVHDLHAKNFISFIPGDFYYSTFEEMLFFIKMVMPIMFIYVVYRQFFSDKEINLILKILIIFISGSIIITNFLGTSLSSYSMEVIKGNFFDWFSNNGYNFSDLASKGMFYFANHIIAILMMFLPLVFCYFIKDSKYFGYVLVFITMFSLLLLGNKTSVFGSYLVFLCMFILYLCKNKIDKKIVFNKYKIIFCISIIVIFPIFIYYSPAYERVITAEGTKVIYSSKQGEKENKLEYIAKNYKSKNISENFITEYYPYEYDPDFWIRIMNEPEDKRIDYRYLEIEIAKRVTEINNSSMDKFLGIGYSRLMNIFNIERDYVNQFFTIGLIGIILLILPYICLFIIGIFMFLKKKQKSFILLTINFSLSLYLFIAYLSGNLLNSLFCMTIFSFLLGYYLQKLKNT